MNQPSMINKIFFCDNNIYLLNVWLWLIKNDYKNTLKAFEKEAPAERFT